jgi:8-oxo-dGTP diphosphatase
MAERPQVCVGAVVIFDGRLLMVQRGTEPGLGRWTLPGGRVEFGETLAEACLRELREETGVDGVCAGMVGWVERFSSRHGYHFVILNFAVTPFSDGSPQPGTDAADARWVPLEDVAELPLVAGLLEFLSDHGIVGAIA